MAKNSNDNTKMTVLEKVLYGILYSFVYVVSLIPFKIIYFLSDGLYLLIYKAVGYRKKVVRENLASSFPEKSVEELREIEKRFYHFFCDYIFETIKLTSMSKEEMKRRVKYTGLEELDKCLNNGHNVALYLGHYCNWEWVTSIRLHITGDILGGQVYHILENKVFNALLLKIRSSMGTESISMQIIFRKIVETNRQNRKMVLGFISDQVPLLQATRYWTTFLNHEGTLVITGTETIAKKCDFSCVYLDISRPKRGYYDINIVPMFEETKDIPDWEITERFIRLFEKTIQRSPEYWLWTHKRWKRNYKEFVEYKERIAAKKNK